MIGIHGIIHHTDGGRSDIEPLLPSTHAEQMSKQDIFLIIIQTLMKLEEEIFNITTLEQVFIHNHKSLLLPSPSTTITGDLPGSAALFMFGERKEHCPENIPLLRGSLRAPAC